MTFLTVYPYGVKEDLIVKLESNSSKSTATYKLSGISLEYDTIFDKRYTTMIGELHAGTTSIPYTNATSIHYKTLPNKDSMSKTDANSLSVPSLQGLLLLFLDKCDDFANKNEEFYYNTIKKVLTTMLCLISFLQQAYKPETFTPS